MSGLGPVLLVAPPGGGGEMLALCLAQHPSFVVIELPGDRAFVPDGFADLLHHWRKQTTWPTTGAGSTAPDLETPLQSGELFGTSPRLRPVIRGDALVEWLPSLLAIHPDAMVIFLLRDVAESVAEVLAYPDLRRRADGGAQVVTPVRAGHRWRSTVTRAEKIEIAYGSDRVLRLRHRDLLADPGASLTRCLAFLGESVTPGHLGRFSPVGSPDASLGAVRAALAPDLLEFSARLLEATDRHLPARPERISKLEAQGTKPGGE